MTAPSKAGQIKSGDEQVMLIQGKPKLNYSSAHTFDLVPDSITQVQVLDDSDDDKHSEWTEVALDKPNKEVPAATNVEITNTEALRRDLDDAMNGDDSFNISEVQKWINSVDNTPLDTLDVDVEDQALSQAVILGTAHNDRICTTNSCTKSENTDTIKDRARKRVAGALKFLEPEMKSDKKNYSLTTVYSG
ncbi:hypothetical protein FGRMN_2502 [Fusarium graminum]|nr:hypothetical protein FGRMN_2502 [Fusarium graminum]